MQALSSFNWFQDLVQSQSQREKMACTKGHAIDMNLFGIGKRKRADSSASVSSPDVSPAKRHKAELDNRATTNNTSSPTPKKAPAADKKAATVSNSSRARADTIQDQQPASESVVSTSEPTMDRSAQVMQTLDSQLNLEILLKHNELRLIEQELAKCQVALEQLRRCELIPYPGETGSPVTPEHVRGGVGPALEPQAGLLRPRNPAPWGVVDGPYTRHYSRWLIPDPEFDPSSPQAPRPITGTRSYSFAENRSTRGHFLDRGSFSASRAQRGSVGSKFQALTPSYQPPKDHHGPLIVVRPSDGQKVRLVCKKCQKDDHRTVQGFLNHCRIAHGLDYKSHSAAAEDCGVAVDNDEPAPAVPVKEQPAPLTAVNSPVTGRSAVHPLITGPRKLQQRGGSTLSSPQTPSPMSSIFASLKTWSAPQTPRPTSSEQNKDFVPSSQTPRLSALFSKRGLPGNLENIVTSVKDRREIDEYLNQPDEHDDDDKESQSGKTASGRSSAKRGSTAQSKPLTKVKDGSATFGGVRVPSRTTGPSRLQLSSSNLDVDDQAGPSMPTSGRGSVSSPSLSGPGPSIPVTPDDETDVYMDLSPHTIDTNPGLVTDNGEDDPDYEESVNHGSDVSMIDADSEPHENVRVRVRGHGDLVSQDEDEVGEGATMPKMVIPPPQPQTASPIGSGTPSRGDKRRRGRPSKRGGGAAGASSGRGK